MVTSVHGEEEQAEGGEPGEDGYWPALEILNERKYDYLVNWDGVDPETGRPWTPSWTRKSEVTEDLIEAWEAKKLAKKKNNRPAPKKSKKPRIFTVSSPTKPATRSSRSSRTSQMSSSRATDSPVISLPSANGSRVSGEPSLGKRKRRTPRHASADDEDPKPVPKRQKVDFASSSSSQKSRVLSIRIPKQISRETIHEEEEDEGPVEEQGSDKVSRSHSIPRAPVDSTVVRIGPPRKRKKITSAATPPSSRRSNSALSHLREEEEENTQEAAGIVPLPDSSPPAVKKKKRRLKPPSDAHPKPPTLDARKPSAQPSRDASQEPKEPSDQEEPFENDHPPPDQDDEPTGPLLEPTPPTAARQQTPPDLPVDDDMSTPAHPPTKKNAKILGHIPRLDPSDFEPHLQMADTTSVIDEFSPKKSFPLQDAIESSIQDSQVHLVAAKPFHQNFDPLIVDDPLDDIVKKMQDVQDAYFDFEGRAGETPHQEQPTTELGSTEQDPPESQSPVESANATVPVDSFNSQQLEDALVILNQKSEEIEGLRNRLAAQEVQIEHLLAESHRVQIESDKLTVRQGVQREALEEANGTVSELGIHIDWLQDSLNKSEAKVKQLQGDMDEIVNVLQVKMEEYELARAEWEQDRASLEALLASSRDIPPQQPSAGWELEKKELEDRLAEVTEGRDQLDKDKRYAENEVETWKEEYRKVIMQSQELRQEAKDAKTEASRIREEKAIIANQTKEAVRLITVKYEAVVEKMKRELAKAELLHKVLQEKDDQTGDDVRRRATLFVHLQEEVRRLREELTPDVGKKAARTAELKGEAQYTCREHANGLICNIDFDSPQELWFHTIGHLSPREQPSE